ncbi:MAG: hypothetical protein R2684_03820 [Pyrinomonadaceae bacterium]
MNNLRFRSVANTDNGDVGSDTIFEYYQEGNLIWADYCGGAVRKGQLVGRMDEEGGLEFVYQHIDSDGSLKAGRCHSKPIIAKGKLRGFSESWKWFSGDGSSGESEIELID